MNAKGRVLSLLNGQFHPASVEDMLTRLYVLQNRTDGDRGMRIAVEMLQRWRLP